MKSMLLQMKKAKPFKKNIFYFGMIMAILMVLTMVTGCTKAEEKEVVSDDNQAQSQQPANETNVETGGQEQTPAEDGESIDKTGWPDVVRFALLPTEDMEMLGRTYAPFIEYLEKRLDRPVELHHPTDYTATVEAMRGKHVEISTFGPFSFVLAYQRANAVPVAIRLTEAGEAPTYESFLITRTSTGIETVEDLEGKDFAFADVASTSGHLFPKALIMDTMNLTLEEVEGFFGNTVFSGGHEASFLAVLNGDVDAAAIYDRAYDRFYERNSDHPNIGEMTVFMKTQPIPNSPFTVRGDLPESFIKAIQDAMLDMLDEIDNPEYPGLREFMEESSAMGGYVPADISVYDIVIQTAELLDMQ